MHISVTLLSHLFQRVIRELELIPAVTGNTQDRPSGTDWNPEHSSLMPHKIPEILWILPEALMLNVNNRSAAAEQQNSTGC